MKFDKSTVAVAVIVCVATVVLILARIRQTSYLAASIPNNITLPQVISLKFVSLFSSRILQSNIIGLTNSEPNYNPTNSSIFNLAVRTTSRTSYAPVPGITLFFDQKINPNVTSLTITNVEAFEIIKSYITSFVNDNRLLFGLGTAAFDQPGASKALMDCLNRGNQLTLASVQSMINKTVTGNTINMIRFFYQPITLSEAIIQNIVAYVLTGITM